MVVKTKNIEIGKRRRKESLVVSETQSCYKQHDKDLNKSRRPLAQVKTRPKATGKLARAGGVERRIASVSNFLALAASCALDLDLASYASRSASGFACTLFCSRRRVRPEKE